MSVATITELWRMLLAAEFRRLPSQSQIGP
jgi:hypothetical protein